MSAGLTPEQRDMLAATHCARGHRFDGINYPTPEGNCPRCAYPEVEHQLEQHQRLLVEQQSQPRASIHPSLQTM